MDKVDKIEKLNRDCEYFENLLETETDLELIEEYKLIIKNISCFLSKYGL